MRVLSGSFADTSRVHTHCWSGGPEDGLPLLLVHGNLVSGGWWRYVGEQLPVDYRVVAPDLRGFGRTETRRVDATRGLRDWSDDLRALVEALGWADAGRVNAAGWSLGGGVLQQYAIDHPADLASLTLVAPLSPYGFGGTRGIGGESTNDDFAGSGGGAVNPDFRRRLAAADRSDDDPASSVRVVMRSFFGPRENVANIDEEFLLDEVMRTAVGDENYPGNSRPSQNWPGVAPGNTGTQNAISPAFCDTTGLADINPKPPVLWVRGVEDQVISDDSMFDFGTLGRIGAVPGWPGADTFPPQPQVAQMRALLDRYRDAGGYYREVVLDDIAHGLPVEAPDRLAQLLSEHVVPK